MGELVEFRGAARRLHRIHDETGSFLCSPTQDVRMGAFNSWPQDQRVLVFCGSEATFPMGGMPHPSVVVHLASVS